MLPSMAYQRIVLRSKLVVPFIATMFFVLGFIWSLYVQFGEYHGRFQNLAPMAIVISAFMVLLSASNFSYMGKIAIFENDVTVFGVFNSTLLNIEDIEKIVFFKRGNRIKKIEIRTKLKSYKNHFYDLVEINHINSLAKQYNLSIESNESQIVARR